MKIDQVGHHPSEVRRLNLIEQINQTWSMAVAIEAAEVVSSMLLMFSRRGTRRSLVFGLRVRIEPAPLEFAKLLKNISKRRLHRGAGELKLSPKTTYLICVSNS